MDVIQAALNLIATVGLGIVAGIPFPVALLARRSIEMSWYSYSSSQRLVRSVLHLALLFAGVAVPWLMYWMSGQLASDMTFFDSVWFVTALVTTVVVLIRKWRLHDSRTWKAY